METYRFTGDRDFLQETAWPILQDGARFMLDWLRENPETDRLITGPGGSPENGFVYTDADGTKRRSYVSIGNTYGLILAKECFVDAMECARILNIDNDLTRRMTLTLPRVQDVPINRDGRIGEWWKPFEEPWKGHRHKSHLYGLFPGNQICVEGTPEYAKAALASLKVRMSDENEPGDVNGGGHTGWNLAWATALWARVYHGEEARASILEQMRTQLNENLFNRCGTPFQVDGNFGVVAGVAEMLLQSHERKNGKYTLRLLPALPKAWSTGQARGLHARGGFIVDHLTWKNGQVTYCTVRSTRGGDLSIVANGKTQHVKTQAGQNVPVVLP
jgi:alpha-L-fucosidase 2